MKKTSVHVMNDKMGYNIRDKISAVTQEFPRQFAGHLQETFYYVQRGALKRALLMMPVASM
jgi:hypothetical protein